MQIYYKFNLNQDIKKTGIKDAEYLIKLLNKNEKDFLDTDPLVEPHTNPVTSTSTIDSQNINTSFKQIPRKGFLNYKKVGEVKMNYELSQLGVVTVDKNDEKIDMGKPEKLAKTNKEMKQKEIFANKKLLYFSYMQFNIKGYFIAKTQNNFKIYQ